MKWLVCFIGFLSNIANSAELPVLHDETKILTIPLAEFRTEDSIVYFQANLQATADFSSFTPLSAELADPPRESSDTSDISLTELNGEYEGALIAYTLDTEEKIEPFSACPPLPFNPGSADITVNTNSENVDFTIDMFPDLVCMMAGIVEADQISGTFQCSDFNDGSWTSRLFTSYPETNILIAKASLIGNSCSFDVEISALQN